MDDKPSVRYPHSLLRAVLVAAVAVVALVAAPGTASAKGTVVPLLDCVLTNGDGSWTAVFGYENTSSSPVRIPRGARNKVTPATVGSPQPTTFRPGTHRGAFTVTVPRGGGLMWHLDGTNLAARQGSATACPSAEQLPADGNGAGWAIALAAATLVGAVALQRERRRTRGGPADA
ncbi:hypothetical protein ACI79G_06570 [Geodermatophilus sp. SYSU D00779]